MTDFILNILIDFGLIKADRDHRKRINEKEKEDGIKRGFQKRILTPSNKFILGFMLLTSIVIFTFFQYQKNISFPNNTSKEITEIKKELEDYKKQFEKYPSSLDQLISGFPLRKNWTKDSWGELYKYSINENGTTYELVSSGPDRKFGSQDDIK